MKIYIDRLKGGQAESLDETMAPDFLEVAESALSFQEKVKVRGETYLADDHLVAHLTVSTSALIPCSVCNDPVRVPILISDLYLSKPLSEITGAIYDLSADIRESILLQVPQFTECNAGKCPERTHMQRFLKDKTSSPQQDVTYFPFASLDDDRL